MKVLYFGQAREAAGVGEERCTLPDRSSVKTLTSRSNRAHKGLEGLSSVIAVNEEVAQENDELSDGDVVAFLPPVAGG